MEKVRKSGGARKVMIIIAIVLLSLILILLAASMVVMDKVFKQNFGTRIDTGFNNMYFIEDFEGLTADRREFKNNRGDTLVGYVYRAEGVDSPKGVIISSHGYGAGGQVGYMDMFDVFAKAGYLVFGYDATANDESGGEMVGGMPQGVADLDKAINYIESDTEMKDLPIGLFGFSWGAYSGGAVLNFHPEVKAAALFSGFNSSTDIMAAQGANIMPDQIELIKPFMWLYELLKFGKYSTAAGVDGFKKSGAAIWVVHGDEDTVVIPEIGVEKYIAAFGTNNPRIRLDYIEGRGHDSDLFRERKAELVAFYDEHLK
ncbi:MAG: prolyl oligopeptidase family serine peptidase [Clostridiales bacterium]|jgi:dienelactone hydrolase|nr:prolyl oligopeptidase family serine peptidase [Clostridiales bacterium]